MSGLEDLESLLLESESHPRHLGWRLLNLETPDGRKHIFASQDIIDLCFALCKTSKNNGSVTDGFVTRDTNGSL